ncbi:MAG: hypothetical protein B7Z20_03455 [Sphingobium sp. 32-64-5]|nr:MAG: hypothetical protein B7Z20_03455 [Sphingobium sp. 32-64-5]
MKQQRFSIGAVGAMGLATLALSACVSSPTGQTRGSGTMPPPPAMQYSRSQPLFGLDARQLVARFGEPRLDIRDRTVRKLQFMTAGGKCVLDVYLYTTDRGREPTVTHMDTRLTDGRDVDAATCGIR